MKLDRILSLLCAVAIAFALSFGCSACIATAFEQELNVDLAQLAAWCALFSFAASLCFSFRQTLLFTGLSLVLLYVFCKYSTLIDSFQALSKELSILFDKGYGWGVLPWGTEHADHTLALQTLGSVIATATAWTVCQKRAAFWAIAGAIIPFLPCTFLLKTVPEERYLCLWIAGIVVILLTQTTRRTKERDGNKLTAIVLIPTILALALLLTLARQDTYGGKGRAEALLHKIELLFVDKEPLLPQMPNLPGLPSTSHDVLTTSSVDLMQVGPQHLPFTPVMEVVSAESESCYLRSRAYDEYNGTSWNDSGDGSSLPWRRYQTETVELTIRTEQSEAYRFQPYRLYHTLHQQAGNTLVNDNGAKEYSYSVHREGDYFVASDLGMDMLIYDYRRLSEIPAETIQWAREYWLRNILPEDANITADLLYAEADYQFLLDINGGEDTSVFNDADFLTRCLEEYFSENKTYSLNTARMPTDAEDFVRWFTEESETGYCVHFASASTVLLRAVGIPARYVTGYLVQTDAEKTTTVYAKDAHAWVEYWTLETGWTTFDPTPSEEETNVSLNVDEPTLPTAPTAQEATKPTSNQEQLETEVPQTDTLDKQQNFLLPNWLIWVFAAFGLIALSIVQAFVRLWLKAKARGKGSNNERALELWRQLQTYKKTRVELPLQIALKAKFSNHTVSEEELREMQRCMAQCVAVLRKRSWHYRVIDRIIFALY